MKNAQSAISVGVRLQESFGTACGVNADMHVWLQGVEFNPSAVAASLAAVKGQDTTSGAVAATEDFRTDLCAMLGTDVLAALDSNAG